MKNKVLNVVYLISIFSLQFQFFASNIVGIIGIIKIMSIITIISLLYVSIIGMLERKETKRSFLIFGLLVMSAVVASLISGNEIIIYLPLLFACNKHRERRQIIQADLATKIAVLVIVLSAFAAGYTNEVNFMRSGVGERETFGFDHPNALGLILMCIAVDLIYIKKHKSPVAYLALVAIVLALMASSSRTPLVMLALLCLFMIMNKKRMARAHMRMSLLKASLISFMFVLVSIIFTSLYITGASMGVIINDNMSGRLYYQSYYQKKMKFSIMGESNALDPDMPLDNGYYKIYCLYGLYGIILVMVFFARAIKIAAESGDDMAKLIVLMQLFYTLSEWHLLKANLNPYLTLPAETGEGRDE